MINITNQSYLLKAAKKLQLSESIITDLGPNEVLIKHEYIGLNFYDADIVRGLIVSPKKPFVPGIEAVGVVAVIGANIDDFTIGERVAYCTHAKGGAYAKYNIVDKRFLIPLPNNISSRDACALLMRGMFAHTILKKVYMADSSSCLLLFNPCGALGYIIAQVARTIDMFVCGIVIDDKSGVKKKSCKEFGFDAAFDHEDVDLNDKIVKASGGNRMNIVIDTIGGDNLTKIIDVMGYCSLFVSLGQNSGSFLKVSMRTCMKRSIFLTRPSLFDYKDSTNELRMIAAEIFKMFELEKIKLNINKIYKFEDLQKALDALRNRKLRFSNLIKVS